MIGTERNLGIELERRDAAKPVGDFVAMITSTIVVMLCFLTFYDTPAVYRGYETPQGIIILVFAALCLVFSAGVLLEKLIRHDFWLARSPGWFYGLTSFVVIIVSLSALMFPYKAGPDYGTVIGTFGAGLLLMLASLLKF